MTLRTPSVRARKAMAWVVWLCLAILLSQPEARAQAKYTMEDIVKRWDERQANVASVRFEWNEVVTRTRGSAGAEDSGRGVPEGKAGGAEVRPPHDYTYVKPNVLAFDRTKIFRKYTTRDWLKDQFIDSEMNFSFDGRLRRSFCPNGRLNHALGGIIPEDHFLDQTVMHVRPILMAYRATDAKVGPYRGLPLKLTGRQAVIRGRSCVEIKSSTRGTVDHRMPE